MTLLEAQLSGSVVIGAKSGGIIDIIEHEYTGLLFEPGNADQLAAQIKAVLTDDHLYKQLLVQARQTVESRFSPRAVANRYEKELGV